MNEHTPANWTGRMAQFFVSNGRLSLLLVVALFAWGIVSYILTPKQYNPKITAPAFQIQVNYPGASRREVLEQVTKPLENVISDIHGVEDIFSVTERGGGAVVTVNFFVGEDFESAKTTLADRIRSNLNLAPLGIQEPVIQSIDPDDVPILTVAVTSDDMDPVQLRKFGFRLRDRLRTVEGASNIEVVGGRKRELAIRVNPERLARSGVGIGAIEAALRRSNVFLPAGLIKGDAEYIPVEAIGTVQRPEDLRNIIVVTGDFGQTRLSDVAEVEERIQEVEQYVRHLKKDENNQIVEHSSVVLLSIAKLKETNISTVTDSIKERINELRDHFIPENVTAEVIVNEGDTAHEEISGLMTNLATAIIIVVAILLIFLDIRAAILVAISIPLTLMSVFGVGLLAGQNINRITLFALILSLGLLVDNATVVIENIVRWYQKLGPEKFARLSPEENLRERMRVVVDAVTEVGPGLFMSTVTTVLAFIPMAFVTGMMGPYMGPIPFFVPAALIMALLISFTINPWMASVVLKPKSVDDHTKKKLPAWISAPITLFDKIGNGIFNFYQNFLHHLLFNRKERHLTMTIITLVLLASLALPAVKLVKFRMLPKADRKQFFLYLDLPSGTPLEETYRVSKAYERLLLEQSEIRMVQSYIGRPPILDFNGLFRGVSARRESNQATLRVGLTHPDTRDLKSAELVLNYRPILEAARREISPDRQVDLKLVEDPPGPPVLSTLLVRVQGYNEELLRNIAADLYPHVTAVDQVVDTDTSIPEDTETIQLVIDPARSSRSRISVEQIVHTLNAAYDGHVLGFYHNENNIEQEYITLRMDRQYRLTPDTLNRITVYNDLGIKVPLKDLVSIRRMPTEKPERRENRQTTVYIYGDMASRSITYSAIDLLFLLNDYRLPDGKGELVSLNLFGAEYRTADNEVVHITLGGEWELTLEVFRDLGIAMGGAIFLVYFVLVAQFASFREPLIIMATIPLSLIGVLPGFMFLGYTTGLYFNATSMIGVIALAGIAVNNSIILLEYLNSLKQTGLSLEEALIEAGTTRFRPILLTTVTTMLGSLTIANDPVWAGLAYAIVFGLGVSSVLTLIVFPVVFYMIKGRDWDPGETSPQVAKK